MNAIIICASTHHGNTRKVADAIAKNALEFYKGLIKE